jgi:hypothetical protein
VNLPRSNDELSFALAELRQAVEALQTRRPSVGAWLLGVDATGNLTATHRDTGVVRVIATP